ncbi:AMP-binding enzyme [Colletotrichum costaricense]|uniref:AMP-binding enzyme n=1 Tax=Colletotrichum costaricense TaxID=1209916 RepID=A0AAJ0E2P1_9PEZI|nr:AMP-binding enzyme [Colletotrichum costaricense]KAK1529035.1 AMP-binding enzyme [Colletotrichum costaricense]
MPDPKALGRESAPTTHGATVQYPRRRTHHLTGFLSFIPHTHALTHPTCNPTPTAAATRSEGNHSQLPGSVPPFPPIPTPSQRRVPDPPLIITQLITTHIYSPPPPTPMLASGLRNVARRPGCCCCCRISPFSAFAAAAVAGTTATASFNLSRPVSRSFVAARASQSARMASTTTSLPRIPLFEAISRHDPESTAVIHSLSGRRFKYGELLGDVRRTRNKLLDSAGKSDLNGERIAFLVENSYDYVVTLLAAFAARSIAVPLSPAFPAAELQYILNQSEASLLVSSAKFAAKAKEVLATELLSSPTQVELQKHLGGSVHERVELDNSDADGAGMMLYTSGTTNRPKGVLLPQSVLTAQSKSLIEAWNYTPADHLLHVLPLHHIHGTVNAVLTPLLSGSTIEFMFPFNADAVWKRLAAPYITSNGTNGTNGTNGVNGTNSTNGTHKNIAKEKITFFTVVPTVYSRLLATHKLLPLDPAEPTREAVSPRNMRLAISGSAALPTPIKEAWKTLSKGNVLLERYGMTEVGMALSCGLDFADRVDGSVGWPLPGVEARLVDMDTGSVIPPGEDVDPKSGRERSGEIQLRGPTIFKEYWRNPEATAKEFVEGEDGKGKWFKTGDVAVRRPVPNAGLNAAQASWAKGDMYFIQGRKSADIIKTGGEKVSALEVERELLSLPEVAEAAVVSVPSGKWGSKVGAVVILNTDVVPHWSPMAMRRALRDRLVNYKIPQVLKVVDHIPRNAMGKINKKQLVQAVFEDQFSGDEL